MINYSYFPILFPNASTQILFDDSIENSFTSSFDSWSNDRKTLKTQLNYQVDIVSAQNVNCPKYLIITHQTEARTAGPKTVKNIAIFANLNVRRYHVDINGVRYPRDFVNNDYASIDYLDQYRVLKLIYREYVGEESLNPFISCTGTIAKFPKKVNDLRFQVDHIDPKKIQLFEDYRGATENARLLMIIFRHRKIKMISDGNKITEVIVFKKCVYLVEKILWTNIFHKEFIFILYLLKSQKLTLIMDL